MGRERSPWDESVEPGRTVVGSSCSWQFSFVEKVKGEKRGIKALHRELEQVDGMYVRVIRSHQGQIRSY